MKAVFFLALTALALAGDEDLEIVLQSPKALMALFNQFNENFHKTFSRQEAPLRMRLFRNDIKKIVQLNKEHEGQWSSGINMFTAMTDSEKAQFLGVNTTLEDEPMGPRPRGPRPRGPRPRSVDLEGRRPRGPRFRGPRPEGPRPQGPRPEGPRPEGPRPRGPRPRGPRPRSVDLEGPRPRGPRPRGPRPRSVDLEGPRPRGPRPRGPRPEGPRPQGPRPDEELEVRSADAVDWRSQGKVTGIKNQGSCGSCWAFAAVAAVETNYAINTNKRKQFAEQEFVDCTYEGETGRDGCQGGWYHDAWMYSTSSGRLATLDAVAYTGVDSTCSYGGKHNGLIAAKIDGYYNINAGEANVLDALENYGAVSVAYEVTDAFFAYTGGIISDNTCVGHANHAVAAVGYTRAAMIVKNSWGQWGRNGYFYTARNHGGCGIYNYAAFPDFTLTGVADTDADYVPTDDKGCSGTNADGCPCGTVRCGDGSCKHAHMCH